MMKLKILPPTLRKNNRYLVVDIKIDSQINKDEIVSIIWNACLCPPLDQLCLKTAFFLSRRRPPACIILF